jgi:hypothetical protein
LALTGWGGGESGVNDLGVGVVDGRVGAGSKRLARFKRDGNIPRRSDGCIDFDA